MTRALAFAPIASANGRAASPTVIASDDGRQRWPAQPNALSATISAADVEIGVRQHDDRILGAALALGALAGGRGAGVDIARHGARADEAHRADLRVIENRVHRPRGRR